MESTIKYSSNTYVVLFILCLTRLTYYLQHRIAKFQSRLPAYYLIPSIKYTSKLILTRNLPETIQLEIGPNTFPKPLGIVFVFIHNRTFNSSETDLLIHRSNFARSLHSVFTYYYWVLFSSTSRDFLLLQVSIIKSRLHGALNRQFRYGLLDGSFS